MGWVVSRVIEFIRIAFQVKEFAVGMAVVDTELVAARAIDGTKVKVEVALVQALPFRVERTVILAAYCLRR